MQTLASEGVAGYYRPEQGDIAIVDVDGVPDAFGPFVLAHEYVHALQDQHHDIEATIDSRPQGDAQTAVAALVEGDATLLMTALAMSDALSGTTAPLPDDQAAIEMDASDLGSMPPMLNRELLFPYLDGLYFAQRMWGRGGWDTVEAVWADPPRSTEQVMHPERYPDDQPIAIELPDVAGLLGKGWTTGRESTMGELRLSILVAGNEDHEIPQLPLSRDQAAERRGRRGLGRRSRRDGGWPALAPGSSPGRPPGTRPRMPPSSPQPPARRCRAGPTHTLSSRASPSIPGWRTTAACCCSRPMTAPLCGRLGARSSQTERARRSSGATPAGLAQLADTARLLRATVATADVHE